MNHFGEPPQWVQIGKSGSLASRTRWKQLTEQAYQLATRVELGDGLQDYIAEAKLLLSDFSMPDFQQALRNRRMLRAVINVWFEDDELAKETFHCHTIQELHNVVSLISRTGALELLQIHLNHYTELDSWSEGTSTCSRRLVMAAVKSQRSFQGYSDTIEVVRGKLGLLLDPDSPQRIAREIIRTQATLEGFLSDLGIHGLKISGLQQRVQQEVYFQRIKDSDPTVEHAFLKELTNESVRTQLGPNGRFLGIALIEALTARSIPRPHDSWVDTILAIGGDPRLTKTDNYRRWWEPCSAQAKERMLQWLSSVDLEIFLAAIKAFGKEENIKEINRMFPDRRRFMLGLLESGLIRESRLFLGSRVRDYIAQQLTWEQRKTIGALKGSAGTSIIYLDCGNFHLVEGSHDFALRILSGERLGVLRDLSIREANNSDFRAQLNRTYVIEGRKPKEIQHNDYEGRWQYRALEEMNGRYGANLQASRMMTRETYEKMRAKHGIP